MGTVKRMIKFILQKFGIKISKLFSDEFSMSSAIKRINHHNIPVNTVIDIGAAVGKWSINVMEFFPKASFLAIEPLKERKNALGVICREHQNFDYALCAAGAIDRDFATIFITKDHLGGSTIDGITGEPRKIQIRTIDSLVSEKMLNGPFFLKFDTHGYESQILEGCKYTLKKTNVIIMEVYNFKLTDQTLRFHQICFHMENLGFRCYDIACPKLRLYDKCFWQMDILFCRSDSDIFSYAQYK